MESIQLIRKAFSKASIVLGNTGISAIYTDRDNWVTQSGYPDFEEFLRVFGNIIGESEEFYVSLKPGRSISLVFKINGVVDEIVFYPPTEHEISIEELREITGEFQNNSDESREFVEFLSGVDFTDDDDVGFKFKEWFDAHPLEEEMVFSLPSSVRYKKMSEIAGNLISAGFLIDNWFPPSGGNNGSFDLQFDFEEKSSRRFSGKSKDDLLKLISLATGVSFELNVECGVFTISFYS